MQGCSTEMTISRALFTSHLFRPAQYSFRGLLAIISTAAPLNDLIRWIECVHGHLGGVTGHSMLAILSFQRINLSNGYRAIGATWLS